ncbi:MAG: hypothetical protein IPP13_28290 [Kouleothrix sp.]|jgi:uncharacterized membrane protein|nr:hypothetical protein [Kouleothrix sp.]
MADPVTLGVIITGLVGAYKAYADYKAATAKAQAEQKPAPAQSAEAARGAQAAPLVKAAVQQYGDAREQQALANFEDDPEMYAGALRTALTRLADRSPAFAAQLQTAAQHANVQGSGVQGNVNVAEGGTVNQATGVNYGTITYQAGKEK